MKKSILRLYCLAFIIYFLTGCTNKALTNKDFNTHKSEIASIAIMPPDIEYFERNPVVTRPNPEYITLVSENVVQAIKNGFTGGTIEIHTLSDDQHNLNQDLSLSLQKVMQSYSQGCEAIRRDGDDKFGFVLDAEAKHLGNYANTNYLLLIHGKGFGRLTSEDQNDVVQAGMLGTASQWDGLLLEIALVDASTAEMLWFNYNKEYQSQYQPLAIESVQELCDRLLNDLYKLAEPEKEKP